MSYQDVLYEKSDGIAIITINRPDVMNAFRSQTVDELIDAFKDAWGVGRSAREPWAAKIVAMSPTAIKIAKQSFNTGRASAPSPSAASPTSANSASRGPGSVDARRFGAAATWSTSSGKRA